MSANKIDGIPEGWELVRIGSVDLGEFVLGHYGDIMSCNGNHWPSKNHVIIRKIEPPKPIDPGEGWRLLEPHEHKQQGDECKFLFEFKWTPVDLCCMKASPDMVYRRRIEPPKPKYVPWDFDTMPDCVRVKAIEDGTRFMARPISDLSCQVKTQSTSYSYLFEHYTQLDGTPCGTVEVSND